MRDRSRIVVFVIIILFLIQGCSVLDSSDSRVKERKTVVDKTKKTYAVKRISEAKYPFDRRFIGTWTAIESSAEFVIEVKNGLVVFSGKDFEDQEQFQIQFIRWDKTTLKGSFLMPSTRHRTLVNLSVLDDNSLRCKYSGDAAGDSIWWRK